MCFPYNCSNGPFILGPSSVCVLLGSYAACDISCGPDPCWDLLGPLSSYNRKVGVGWRVDHPGLTLTSNRLTGYWWCTFQKKNPVKCAKNWSNKYRLVITIIEVAIVPLVSRLVPPLSPLPPREVFLFSLPSFPYLHSHLSNQNGGLRRVWEHRFSC